MDLTRENRWEAIAVALYLAQDYLESVLALGDSCKAVVYTDGPRLPSLRDDSNTKLNHGSLERCGRVYNGGYASISTGFIFWVSVLDNLEHDEPRIRSLVAKILGSSGH